jgi:hypothetical protein
MSSQAVGSGRVGSGYAATRSQSARRVSTETKASFKTTEFLAYLGAVAAVIVMSAMVGTTNNHSDYFRADKAVFYIVLLTIGYMVSRGIAKSGSRDFYDDDRD